MAPNARHILNRSGRRDQVHKEPYLVSALQIPTNGLHLDSGGGRLDLISLSCRETGLVSDWQMIDWLRRFQPPMPAIF